VIFTFAGGNPDASWSLQLYRQRGYYGGVTFRRLHVILHSGDLTLGSSALRICAQAQQTYPKHLYFHKGHSMTITRDGQAGFSKLRLFFWPIHSDELRKLVPMLIIFFLVSFDYNILRTMKDTVVLYAPESGAEVLPFLKVWAMFPATLLMTYLFTRLSNRHSRQTVTYAFMGAFLLYFILFAAIAYPNRELLEPTTLADGLQGILPSSFKWPILLLRNWVFTSFYVMAELWSNIIFFLLFWGFANQITRLNEAKRFYGLLGVGANLSGAAAGQTSVFLSRLDYNAAFPYGHTQWEQSMFLLIAVVIAAGIAIICLFRWMHTHVLNDPRYYDPQEATADGKLQGKLSMRDSFRYLLNSRYLLSLALIVLCYNVVINLVEVMWKFQVKELYPNQNEYNVYMNNVATFTSFLATLSALLLSSNSIRKFGWTFTAMLTPAILLLTSVAFFAFFFLKEYRIDADTLLFGLSPLALAVFVGSGQNIMCRAAKYSVFDATKEMAFVPLSSECKLKGKAAIDGVGSRLGKTGGSLIHQGLLFSLASFSQSAPYVAGLLILCIGAWIVAVRVTGRAFNTMTQPAAESPSATVAAADERPLLATGELKQQVAH
jgi:AAA family ATP:ADP antiporter